MSRSDHDPAMTNGYSGLLDDVIEEVANRLQAGDAVDYEAILAQYPEHAESLLRLLPAIAVMADFGVSASRLAALGVSPGLSPLAGELGVLGDFRILREVGRGGMGIVYEAEQMSLGRRVALKVLPFAAAMDPTQLRRFKTEAQAAAQLHHTNIVPVFWVGCENGVHYFAMQFIEGRTLADIIRELRRLEGTEKIREGSAGRGSLNTGPTECLLLESRLPAESGPAEAGTPTPGEQRSPASVNTSPPDASSRPIERVTTSPSSPSTRNRAYFRNVARLGVEAAEALEHAHQEGIIHRDIKPANLMVDAKGSLWVTDFGLARLQSDSGLTVSGDLIGTLRYMSPEQASGKRVMIDARTDIYSLGATLYELLTLQSVFESRDRQELLRQIADEDPRTPRKLNGSIPRELETIILKAMTKEPTGRYQTAKELADDLRRFLEHRPILAKRPNFVERTTKWAQRHRGVVASAAIMIVLTIVGLAISTVLIEQQRRRAIANLDRANEQRDLANARSRELDATYTARERQLYISLVNRAYAEWSLNNVAFAGELLDQCPPNRRGWEWYHCLRLCHLERLTLNSGGLPINSLAFGPDGRWLITAAVAPTEDGVVGVGRWTIWDTETGGVIESRQGVGVRVVAVDPSGTMAAVGSSEGGRIPAVINLWRTTPGWPPRMGSEPAAVMRTHHPAVDDIAFSPDGRQLASLSLYASFTFLEVWDVPSGRLAGSVNLSDNHTKAVAFRPDGKQLAVAFTDGIVKLFDATTLLETAILRGHNRDVNDVAYGPDGRYIATCGLDKTVRLWDVASGRPVDVLRGHESFVRAVAFHPDGTRIASAAEDNTVRLWDRGSGDEIGLLRGHSRFVSGVAFSPDGRRLASASEDGTVKIWDDLAVGPSRRSPMPIGFRSWRSSRIVPRSPRDPGTAASRSGTPRVVGGSTLTPAIPDGSSAWRCVAMARSSPRRTSGAASRFGRSRPADCSGPWPAIKDIVSGSPSGRTAARLHPRAWMGPSDSGTSKRERLPCSSAETRWSNPSLFAIVLTGERSPRPSRMAR